MSKLLFATLILLGGCTIIPTYRLSKREFCERTYYDRICPGTDREYNLYPTDERGIYD